MRENLIEKFKWFERKNGPSSRWSASILVDRFFCVPDPIQIQFGRIHFYLWAANKYNQREQEETKKNYKSMAAAVVCECVGERAKKWIYI